MAKTSGSETQLLKPFDVAEGEQRWPVTVVLDNVSVNVQVTDQEKAYSRNVWSTFKEDFSYISRGKFLYRQEHETAAILSQVNETFVAGTSTLVLGPPSSGKSTLLKVIGGRCRKNEQEVLGSLTFSGTEGEKLNLNKVCSFIEQVDIHYPLLTVNQTLNFAFEAAGGKRTLSINGKNNTENEPKPVTGAVSEVVEALGLTNAQNTIAGDEIFRGISGGEKKRLTVGEMLFMRQPVMLCDEITTGLDSTTAFRIVEGICRSAKTMQTTPIVTLLQPSPDLIGLFDKILVLCEGYVIYHGPEDKVSSYFKSIGYEQPISVPVAEFLVDMATTKRESFRVSESAPQTAEALASSWRAVNEENMNVDSGETEVEKVDTEYYLKTSSAYSYSVYKDTMMVLRRQLLLLWTEKIRWFVLLGNLIAIITVTGALFFDLPFTGKDITDTTWYTARVGASTFAVIVFSLNAFISLSIFAEQKKVFYKQNDASFHRTATYVFATVLSSLGPSLFESMVVITIVTYMSSILNTDDSDFFGNLIAFIGFGFLSNVVVEALLKIVVFSTRTLVEAILKSCLVLISMLSFSGFIIPFDTLPNYFIWLYWLNPISWIFRGVQILIFTSDAFSEADGAFALSVYGLPADRKWIAASLLYCAGFYVVVILLQVLCLMYLRKGKTLVFTGKKHDKGNTELAVVEEHVSKEDVFLPLTVAFQNMSYTVSVSKSKNQGSNEKILLHNIYGYAKPGECTALMGPTGAGKSTLMDVIAFRKTKGKRDGDIMVNGNEITSSNKRQYLRVTGYVEQQDNHSPRATVYEAIRFSAYLRQGENISSKEKERTVENIISLLQLERVRNQTIGVPEEGFGLSKHEAKRVTIGVELAGNPSVLFLDEPTSGLDSQAAYIVMRAVANVSNSGRTVICTIHQPSKEIFSFFDQLILLSRGKLVYFGSTSEVLDHFQKYNDLPYAEYNVADFVLDTIASSELNDNMNGSSLPDISLAELGHNNFKSLADEFRKTSQYTDCVEEVTKMAAEPSSIGKYSDFDRSSLTTQSMFIIMRWWALFWRLPSLNLTRVYVATLAGVFCGLLLLQDGLPSSQIELQSFLGINFMQALFFGFVNSIASLQALMKERNVYYREKNSRMYPVAAYVFGSAISEIPYVVISNSFLYFTFYFLVGLDPSIDVLLIGWALLNAYVLVNAYIGHLLAATFSTVSLAIMIACAVSSFFGLFSGFILGIDELPSYFAWCIYVDPAYFYLNGVFSNLLFCNCDVDPLPQLVPTCDGGNSCVDVCDDSGGCEILRIPFVVGNQTFEVPINTWQFTRGAFGYEKYIARDIGVLLAMAVVVKCFEVIVLTYFVKAKR